MIFLDKGGCWPEIPPIADHIITGTGLTKRQWKEQKRKQVRAVESAIDELRMGCSYVPAGSDCVEVAAKAMELLKEYMNVKNWGR